MLENARVLMMMLMVILQVNYAMIINKAELIGIVIDVNDRYGFNNTNYKSDSGKLKDLVDCMTNIIKK